MSRNRRRPFFTPVFVLLLAALLTAALLLAANGAQRKEQAEKLASLTPTPTGIPRKVSYIYDRQTPAPTPLLIGNGKEGPVVAAIQQRLRELGYYQGEVDGQFGAQTRLAVLAFQQASGLTADGVVGETTYRLLMGQK